MNGRQRYPWRVLGFMSDGELARAEFGELEDLVLGICWLLVLTRLRFVAVGGLALTIRGAHVH